MVNRMEQQDDTAADLEPRPSRRRPLLVAAAVGAVLIAVATFFLGRLTQNNSYEAQYQQQHLLIVGEQQSLANQQSNYNRRQAQLNEQVKALASADATLTKQTTTLTQQKAALTQQQATLAQQQTALGQGQAALAASHATLTQQQTALTQAQAALAQAQAALTPKQAALTAQQASLTKQQTALTAGQNQLKQQQAAVAQQAATLTQQLDEVKATQFKNGLFQVGRDIQPGLYHSGGATNGNCAWAILNSSNPTDLAQQGNSSGPQTVSITGNFFSSRGCTTWTKIG